MVLQIIELIVTSLMCCGFTWLIVYLRKVLQQRKEEAQKSKEAIHECLQQALEAQNAFWATIGDSIELMAKDLRKESE